MSRHRNVRSMNYEEGIFRKNPHEINGTGSFRPESRSPPESFRPYSRSPGVVSPSFINSALKNGKYHCKYSYFGCCKACLWVLYFCLPHN